MYSTFHMDVPEHTHCPPAGYIESDRARYYESFSFAFVRNPWDRMVSAFHYLKHVPKSDDDVRWASENLSSYACFGDFMQAMKSRSVALRIMSWRHFLPQSYFIYDVRGRKLVNYVGRFEILQEEVEYIGERIGIDPVLTRENATVKKDYRLHYTKSSRNLVERLYRNDINRFGYTFDGQAF